MTHAEIAELRKLADGDVVSAEDVRAVGALLDEVERLRGALRCLHATVRGYECESFGHDVLEAAMEDARRVLGEAGKDGG